MRQAYIIRTSRDKPLVYPVMTQVALLCDAFIVVKGDGIVGAYIDAGLTSGTQIEIHDDNAVLSFADGFFRTGLDTGRFVAVAAQIDLKDKILLLIDYIETFLANGN